MNPNTYLYVHCSLPSAHRPLPVILQRCNHATMQQWNPVTVDTRWRWRPHSLTRHPTPRARAAHGTRHTANRHGHWHAERCTLNRRRRERVTPRSRLRVCSRRSIGSKGLPASACLPLQSPFSCAAVLQCCFCCARPVPLAYLYRLFPSHIA